MIKFDDAMHDPQRHYNLPENVVEDDQLSVEQKIQLLKQWKHDALELMVADEENMSGDSDNMLQRVLNAINKLENR